MANGVGEHKVVCTLQIAPKEKKEIGSKIEFDQWAFVTLRVDRLPDLRPNSWPDFEGFLLMFKPSK